jgi:hypothetical protein
MTEFAMGRIEFYGLIILSPGFRVHPRTKTPPYFSDDRSRNLLPAIIAKIPATRFATTHINIKIAAAA